MHKIVLLDDQSDSAADMATFFNKKADFELNIVNAEAELFEAISAPDVDLVLANAGCLFFDVLGLCQTLRNDSTLCDLPFMLIAPAGNFDEIERAFDLGVNDYIVKPINPEEMLLRIRAQIRVYARVRNLRSKSERLAYVVAHDPLTKVSNRMHMQTLLRQAVKESERYAKRCSLIYLRVNDMQRINALYGYAKGDRLLFECAQLIDFAVRDSDVVARWGGGDFVVLTPNTGADAAKVIAAKIDRKLEATEFIPSLQVQFSYGITEVISGDNEVAFLKRSQDALRVALSNHSVNVCVL